MKIRVSFEDYLAAVKALFEEHLGHYDWTVVLTLPTTLPTAGGGVVEASFDVVHRSQALLIVLDGWTLSHYAHYGEEPELEDLIDFMRHEEGAKGLKEELYYKIYNDPIWEGYFRFDLNIEVDDVEFEVV